MSKILLFIVCMAGISAAAQDLGPGPGPGSANGADFDREPAAVVTPNKKRSYPGGGDEEDLRVQPALPEAVVKTDARSVQREIYKQLFNQELREEQQNDLEE